MKHCFAFSFSITTKLEKLPQKIYMNQQAAIIKIMACFNCIPFDIKICIFHEICNMTATRTIDDYKNPLRHFSWKTKNGLQNTSYLVSFDIHTEHNINKAGRKSSTMIDNISKYCVSLVVVGCCYCCWLQIT